MACYTSATVSYAITAFTCVEILQKTGLTDCTVVHILLHFSCLLTAT